MNSWKMLNEKKNSHGEQSKNMYNIPRDEKREIAEYRNQLADAVLFQWNI